MNPTCETLSRTALELAYTALSGGKWQGFLWLSDASHPVTLVGKALPSWTELKLDGPRFVHEAWLWEPSQRLSVAIRQVEENFLLRQVVFASPPSASYSQLTRSLPGIAELDFYQFWAEVPDTEQPLFRALLPSWTALVGIKTQPNAAPASR